LVVQTGADRATTSEERIQVTIEKLDLEPKYWDRIFAPSSCLAIITTCDEHGAVNAASYGTCTRVKHDPVYIAFTAEAWNDTVANLGSVPEFVVNLPRFEPEMLSKVLTVGMPFDRGVSELDKAGLTALDARSVRPPRVADCPRHFECEVEWTKEWDGRVMIVGKVVAVSVDADCVDENNYVLWDRVKSAHFCGAPYWNQFVAAYDSIAVEPSYDGPERAAYDEMARRVLGEG
jgi:flavin reductase (DIM6/NTAB) family NADH-FMN oxidoreductase RutF